MRQEEINEVQKRCKSRVKNKEDRSRWKNEGMLVIARLSSFRAFFLNEESSAALPVNIIYFTVL
jgi:hypothetical protein